MKNIGVAKIQNIFEILRHLENPSLKIKLPQLQINQFASSTFIALLSFDRYLAVCHAVKSTRWRTRLFASLLAVVAWILVMCEMIPIFMYSTIVERPLEGENRNKSSCTLFWGNTEFVNDTETENAIYSRRRLFTIYSFTLSYLIPLTAIWFFYSNIILRVWLRKSKFFSLQRQRTRRTTTKVCLILLYIFKSSLQVTIMGLAIVISYTLLYFPFWMSQWLIEAGVSIYKDQSLRMIIAYLAYSLLYINSALNPFLCVIFTDTFLQKVAFYRLLLNYKLLQALRRHSETAINGRSVFESTGYTAIPLADSARQSRRTLRFESRSP